VGERQGPEARNLSEIALVARRRSCGQMSGRRLEKLDVYSLEFIEEFVWPSTRQFVAYRSPQ